MTLDDAYAQGARCGHIEGKARCSVYVEGEEAELSWEAADNQGFDDEQTGYWWAKGYRYGYRKGAEGSALDQAFVNPLA